jgi:hypothetical protein
MHLQRLDRCNCLEVERAGEQAKYTGTAPINGKRLSGARDLSYQSEVAQSLYKGTTSFPTRFRKTNFAVPCVIHLVSFQSVFGWGYIKRGLNAIAQIHPW